jgi:hypothetical protein
MIWLLKTWWAAMKKGSELEGRKEERKGKFWKHAPHKNQ